MGRVPDSQCFTLRSLVPVRRIMSFTSRHVCPSSPTKASAGAASNASRSRNACYARQFRGGNAPTGKAVNQAEALDSSARWLGRCPLLVGNLPRGLESRAEGDCSEDKVGRADHRKAIRHARQACTHEGRKMNCAARKMKAGCK